MASGDTRRTVLVKLDPDVLAMLGVLGDPPDVLYKLAFHASEGIKRPGTWARAAVISMFGPDFERNLERDPANPWRERVRPVSVQDALPLDGGPTPEPPSGSTQPGP